MDRINRYKSHGKRFATCTRFEHEEPTIQGLAYTPSDMMRMAERGIPVNNVNNQKAYFDGSPDATFFIGDERRRGVDVADLWEKDQQIRIKARDAAHKAKRSKK